MKRQKGTWPVPRSTHWSMHSNTAQLAVTIHTVISICIVYYSEYTFLDWGERGWDSTKLLYWNRAEANGVCGCLHKTTKQCTAGVRVQGECTDADGERGGARCRLQMQLEGAAEGRPTEGWLRPGHYLLSSTCFPCEVQTRRSRQKATATWQV